MQNLLIKHIANKLNGRRHLCVALSGGLDSMVLLHALVALRDNQPANDITLRAIHVHHGLSVYADQWVVHCELYCKYWQVDLDVIRVRIDPQQGGIEAAARTARYAAFAENLSVDETLLAAQHLNDQCETFMLALKRGSGPAGLSAMGVYSVTPDYGLLRPLLDIPREQLENYAHEVGLKWIEDDSNQDIRFDRNFLRLQVLPELYQRWPHFAPAVARSASLCAEQESLLNELLQESLNELTDEEGSLDINQMLPMSAARRFALLRRWLTQQNVRMPSREQLQRIWDEVALSRCDAEPAFRLGSLTFRRFRQRLYLLPLMTSLRELVLNWAMSQPLTLPDNLGQLSVVTGCDEQSGIRLPNADESVTVRFRAEGIVDKVGRHHTRHIKKLWQELGVPPWQRDRIPLIFYNDQLIAAPGFFITEQAQAKEGEGEQHVLWSSRKK